MDGGSSPASLRLSSPTVPDMQRSGRRPGARKGPALGELSLALMSRAVLLWSPQDPRATRSGVLCTRLGAGRERGRARPLGPCLGGAPAQVRWPTFCHGDNKHHGFRQLGRREDTTRFTGRRRLCRMWTFPVGNTTCVTGFIQIGIFH